MKCHAAPVLENLLEPFDLGDADSRVDFAKSIVVSQPLVRQPVHPIASLVSQRFAKASANLSSSVTIIPPSPVVICLLG